MENKSRSDTSGFNWGTGIFIAVALFVTATLSVVGYLVSLEYHLVSDRHYEEAVSYQDHINRVERTERLKQPVNIRVVPDEASIQVDFSRLSDHSDLKGTIELYRPSDSSLDQKTDLLLDENGSQLIPVQDMAKGKWLVKITWSSEDGNYFTQESIFL